MHVAVDKEHEYQSPCGKPTGKRYQQTGSSQHLRDAADLHQLQRMAVMRRHDLRVKAAVKEVIYACGPVEERLKYETGSP